MQRGNQACWTLIGKDGLVRKNLVVEALSVGNCNQRTSWAVLADPFRQLLNQIARKRVGQNRNIKLTASDLLYCLFWSSRSEHAITMRAEYLGAIKG